MQNAIKYGFENNKMYIIRKTGQKYVDKHKKE